jgi:tetratricopeptide (TPR) repeat protein
LTCGFGEPVKVEDPLQSPGWQHFYNNEYDEATADFEKEVAKQPNEASAYNHLAQAILYRELFRNGALESQLVTGNNPFLRSAKMNISASEKAAFQKVIGEALSLAAKRVEHDSNDQDALYALSVSYGLRANFRFLVEKAWTDSLHDATASRKYSDRLLELNPNLTDAYLVQGLHNYIVGSLPFYAKMVGFLAGFHGDREKGLKQIEMVSRKGVLNRYDAQILLAVIYRRERRPNEAIPLLKNLAATFPKNYLFRLEQVQMFSDAGNKASALEVLAEVDRLRAAAAPGFQTIPVEKLKYLRGNLLFWYGDIPPALKDMQEVTLRTSVLDMNTAVLAWLRLGQLYDLQGKHADAVAAYRETMKTAPDSPAANEAKSYISSPYRRKAANS